MLNNSVRNTTTLETGIATTTTTLTKVAKFKSDYDAVSAVGAGTVTGGTLAVGSWALVSALGSASSGTAIAGLSGAAATNATLAWFGGGALAAGGVGMSGGALVLGGIVAIPLVFVAAKGTHKKAEEIEDEIAKVEATMATLKEQLDAMPDFLSAVKTRRDETTSNVRHSRRMSRA
ncbi:hypothetical protein AWB68_07618 [Caballeronia choica]|uniref:Uncharacterized protein n=1 Tax=Caballeronia choica TaxID=326476 RepID=A0A158KVT0_9BURK|nr:hypothetical protein [Caballeronia choica]SAL85262.1 hypothetical protein AWB68_07618 [Caballeronia choica]